MNKCFNFQSTTPRNQTFKHEKCFVSFFLTKLRFEQKFDLNIQLKILNRCTIQYNTICDSACLGRSLIIQTNSTKRTIN